MGTAGFAPTTGGLKVQRSTVELRALKQTRWN